MAETTKTTTIAPVWGVTKTFTGVPGIITDWEGSDEAQTNTVQNEIGETIYTKVYDVKQTVTCTLVTRTNGTVPKVGDELTVGSDKYILLSIRLIQNNQSVQKHALTLERWAGAPKAS